MSYILDALKKSEQERQRGAVPGLHTVQASATGGPGHRSRWPLVLALALLLNAGLLVWWLTPWQSTNLQSVKQPATGRRPPANHAAAAGDPLPARPGTAFGALETKPESQPETQPASRQPSPEGRTPAPVASKPTVEYIDDNRPKLAQVATASRASNRAAPKADTKAKREPASGQPRKDRLVERPAVESTKKAGSAAAPADIGQDPARWQQRAWPQAPPAAPAPPGEAREAPEGMGSLLKPNDILVKPAAADRKASPSARAPAEQSLPELRELPLAIRKDLPNLSFSMVVHAPRPAERMININGRTMREGQEISPGLKLEEITPNGAIFNFQGHRFRKGVF
jgi:general secretion pathway protein B